jgi:hypothetical protein
LGILATLILIAVYVIFPKSEVTQVTPTPAIPIPTTLLAQTTNTVSIGNPVKTTGCKSDGILPDRECTPGSIDPNVTQQIINGTVCIVGYTDKVRPPESVTNKIKVMQLAAYGFPDTMSDYELDHLISLELGGCPDCVSNLWPEPYNISMGAREKDKVENYLHKAVCNGEMTLAEAQLEIATDWTAVYYRIYGK